MKPGNEGDCRKIRNRIVAERAVKTAVDCEGCRGKQHRVAIRIGSGGHFISDIGAGASPVLDDGLLAPDFRQLLGDGASDNVGRSSRGKRHNEAHDSIGPVQRLRLRPRGTTAKAEREGGPGGQSNQAAAREHDYLLAAFVLSEHFHLRIAATAPLVASHAPARHASRPP